MAKKDKNKQVSAGQNSQWYIIGGILILTTICFWGVKECDFLSNWDDDGYVIRNTHIYQISAENIKNLFTSYYKSNYQPVSMLTYLVEFSIFKLQPAPYHITNLLFHLLNTVLVFLFIKKLAGRNDVSGITTLFFAIHPMHVESVAWISERKDVVYATFYLMSMMAYLSYLGNTENRKYYWQTFGLFLLSALSKSMAVTLPLILLTIDYYRDRKFNKQTILEKIPFFAISLVFGAVALNSQSGSAMDIVPDFSIINRFFITCYSVMFYIFKLFIPTGLASIHYYPDNSKALPMVFYAAPVVILLIGILIWKAKTFRKELLFGFGFFLLSISIVLQIIPVGHAFASERYSYVPYIGLFFIIAQFYAWLTENKFSFSRKVKPLTTGMLITGAIIFSVMTFERVKVWTNSILLYSDTIEKYPESAHARWMLANVKKDYKQYEASILDYDKAIALDPGYARAYFNRGGSKANLNKPLEALKDYNKAIELDSLYEPAFNNRGNAYTSIGKYELAIKDYQSALKLNPQYGFSLLGCGNAYQALKNYPKAIEYYEQAVEADPNYAEALHNLGVAYYYNNQKDKACEKWNLALSLNYAQSANVVRDYCK